MLLLVFASILTLLFVLLFMLVPVSESVFGTELVAILLTVVLL